MYVGIYVHTYVHIRRCMCGIYVDVYVVSCNSDFTILPMYVYAYWLTGRITATNSAFEVFQSLMMTSHSESSVLMHHLRLFEDVQFVGIIFNDLILMLYPFWYLYTFIAHLCKHVCFARMEVSLSYYPLCALYLYFSLYERVNHVNPAIAIVVLDVTFVEATQL